MRDLSKYPNRKLFFHCTVGEDRTGYLAGLWDVLTKKNNHKVAFQKQMCERGYSRGNPHKPEYVVKEIRKDLTPLFLGMLELIKEGKIRLESLSSRACSSLNVVVGGPVPKCKKQKVD